MNENTGVALSATPQHPFVNLIDQVHSVLSAIENKAAPLMKPASPLEPVSLNAPKPEPMTPVELEIQGVLNHARSLLNRF